MFNIFQENRGKSDAVHEMEDQLLFRVTFWRSVTFPLSSLGAETKRNKKKVAGRE